MAFRRRIRVRESSSSSSFSPPWNYEVFLSFRGEDTRKNFINPLHSALIEKGVLAFKDDNELRRGEEISSELLKAIAESKTSIVVISRNYASSRWCLDELLKIMECRKTMGQLVMPVFYEVDRLVVRNQSGSFAEAFAAHEERFKEAEMVEKMQNWREALTESANLPGWDLRNVATGCESKFIQVIVEEVLTKLNFNVAKYPIGIDFRVREMYSLLDIWSDDVRIVGISGMGGIGKTTIAKATYNLIFHKFDGSSFLGNVREVSEQPNGLVSLQEKLLSDILKKENLGISDVNIGINVIKKRLSTKRVIVVLDDVDQQIQLNSLAGKSNWFGLGSRIIITTRNEHLLHQLEVDEIYKLKELDDKESVQLLSRHAFRKNHPTEDYLDISKHIAGHVGGLPLALEVQGSFLCGRRNMPEWKNTVEELIRIPCDQIYRRLRTSLGDLDDKERDIFLDIACFFVGMDKDYAIGIWESCGFFSKIGISDLVQRSLITINERNELVMHDLLRDMAKEIVCEESFKDSGKRSRLWFHKDVYDVLTGNMGTEAIEGLILNLPTSNDLYLSTEAFAKMPKLRLLQLNNVHLRGSYGNFSRELRWLCWHGFPLECIPTDFHIENLLALDLQHSNITQVWKENKLLKDLRVLDLSYCKYLTETPNFSRLTNLEGLIFEGCTSLVELHHSIGDLGRLVFLNLKGCSNLRKLPRNIYNLNSLENLILSGCSNLKNLPSKSWISFFCCWKSTRIRDFFSDLCFLHRNVSESAIPNGLGGLSSLQELNLSYTNFCSLPTTIICLPQLQFLKLENCTKLKSLPELPSSLKGLNAEGCTAMEILPNLGKLSSLKELNLCKSNLCSLPSSINCISQLKILRLENCTRLKSIPDLPSSLKCLKADGCTSLEKMSNIGSLTSLQELSLCRSNFCRLPSNINLLSQLQILRLENCTRLNSLPELPSNLEALYADGCTSMERLPNLSNLKNLSILFLNDCNMLIEIQGLERLDSIRCIHMDRCNNLTNTFKMTFFQVPLSLYLSIYLSIYLYIYSCVIVKYHHCFHGTGIS
uniref:TIR domain-containing protein n=1 Tax=Nelumbo nucifera TaxID=4432 RepID=A0A822ZVY8_NELNU|nr:TPA_asm: hypothetical protein HUJ06_004318 [Nelumbo nucifera]